MIKLRRETALAYSVGILLAVFNMPPSAAIGAEGDVVAAFSLSAHAFKTHPSENLLYVSHSNSVSIINTATLSLQRTVEIGTNTRGLALSPDAQTLYVALRGDNRVMALDSHTLALQDQYVFENAPFDIEVDGKGHLYASPADNFDGVMRYDIPSHTYEGRLPNDAYPCGYVTIDGFLEMSADRRTLYYAQSGFSPAVATRYDIASSPWPVCTDRYNGVNGQDLVLSPNETELLFVNGGIARALNPNTMADIGFYPPFRWSEGAYSPDSTRVYLSDSSYSGIGVFSVADHQQMRTYTTPGITNGPYELSADTTGRYLFAAYSGTLRVFDTGQVPEPLAIGPLALIILIFRRQTP